MPEEIANTATLAERVRDLDLIERALKQAFREVIQRHRQAGAPIAVWKDDKVVWIAADEVERSED